MKWILPAAVLLAGCATEHGPLYEIKKDAAEDWFKECVQEIPPPPAYTYYPGIGNDYDYCLAVLHKMLMNE